MKLPTQPVDFVTTDFRELASSSASDRTTEHRTPRRTAEWWLIASIALCVLDGAIRKWILRDDEGLLKYVPYFSKDIAFALILFIPRPKGMGEFGRKLWTFLKVGLAFCAVGALASTIFNWGSFNFVGAALSVRSLFFLPLCALLAIPRLQRVNLPRLALLIGALTL